MAVEEKALDIGLGDMLVLYKTKEIGKKEIYHVTTITEDAIVITPEDNSLSSITIVRRHPVKYT